MQRTKTQQRQIAQSSEVKDNLPLGQTPLPTLEEELNYIRSVIRNMKGTPAYDSLVGDTLDDVSRAIDDIYDTLSNVSFDNATLTGNSTSTTPPVSDPPSDRIATTQYVSDVINSIGATDAHYVFADYANVSGGALVWEINHPLNKYPSVTVYNTENGVVECNVDYDGPNKVILTFSTPTKGVAYLN